MSNYDPFEDKEYLKLFEEYASKEYGLVDTFSWLECYHYSTVSALKSIIENNELWLTRIDFLNDIDEVDYSKKLIIKILEEYNDNFFTKKIKSIIKSESFNNYLSRRYVLSLSQEKDNLALWSEYSHGEGYNFCINITQFFIDDHKIKIIKDKEEDALYLVEELEKENGYKEIVVNADIKLYRVLYDEDKQNELINKYLTEINEWYIRHKDEMDEEFSSCAINWVIPYLFSFAVSFKKHSFYQENEVRLVVVIEDENIDSKISSFKEKYNVLMPYIKLRFPKRLPMTSVCIGPKNNMDVAEKGMRLFLDSHQYPKAEIKRSEIKLRY